MNFQGILESITILQDFHFNAVVVHQPFIVPIGMVCWPGGPPAGTAAAGAPRGLAESPAAEPGVLDRPQEAAALQGGGAEAAVPATPPPSQASVEATVASEARTCLLSVW